VPDAETLTRLGHPVYLDFLSRTGYRFNARRRDPERFRAWAEALYRFPKVRILGAFQGSELAAVLICFQVRDVVYYSTQFGNQTALKNNANDLLLHTVKVGVARSPDVRVLFAATAGMPRGLDGFYLQRGFQRRSSPARLRGNPLTLAALRLFFPKACGKLAWSSQQPRAEESSPVAPGPPAQTSGAPKPVRALRLERGAVPPAP